MTSANMSLAQCARTNCPCSSSWNGVAGEYCCRTCATGIPCSQMKHLMPTFPTSQPVKFARCANRQCVCTASYSGRTGDYCCKACQKGTPCTSNVHTSPQVTTLDMYLCVAGCGRPTHNGLAGEFCGRTCRKSYASNMKTVSLTDYESIKAQADFWARGIWPASVGRILRFYNNPGLGDLMCPSRVKYEAGVRQLGVIDTSQSEFAWHGSPGLTNVKSICWDGLDPGRRSGQAHGPGEYFSTDATVSNSFAGSSGYLALFLLIKGPHNTTANGSYRVVNNPRDGKTAYCLPIGVVAHRARADPNLKGSGSK